MRSDNGGDYISNQFEQFLKNCGIKHETSVPENADQDGRAERINHTTLDWIRCMLLDSGFSKNFWAEASATAVYLTNRYPKVSLGGKTAEEVWLCKLQDLSHLRIFGCDAMAHVPKNHQGKLDSKVKKCKMFGYASNQKAH